MSIEANNPSKRYAYSCVTKSNTPNHSLYYAEIMNQRVLIAFMDFMMNVSDGTAFDYGKSLVMSLIVCQSVPLSMKRFCACMVVYRQN